MSDTAPGQTLAAALVAAQAAMPKIVKDDSAEVQTKAGGTYSYKYLSLNALIELTRPVLNQHGLGISQWPTVSELGQPILRTILFHTSGEQWQADMPLGQATSMQQLGGQITYVRRYAWQAVIGVAADEDNDGAESQPAAKPAQRGPKAISNAQRTRLFAIAKQEQVDEERLRQIIRDFTGDPDGSTTSITQDRYDELVGLVEAEGVPF